MPINIRMRRLMESAWAKTLGFFVSVVLTGLLASSFVAEFYFQDRPIYKFFYHSWSFYGILGILLIAFFYYRFLEQHDKQIGLYKDEDYCMAYLRRECLPAYAESLRTSIRNGTVSEDLKDLRKIHKELFK